MDEARLLRTLVRHGLASEGEPIVLYPLGGGVSCDVFRVDLAQGPICVKQALPQLRVAAEWRVDPARAHVEAAWLALAATIGVPAPELLFEDRDDYLFGMAFCRDAEPWKARLLRGETDPTFAAAVGHVLARMHGATRGDERIAHEFANAALFEALRIDPFILECGRVFPALEPTMRGIAETTRQHASALIHGDFSPKNILYRTNGPVVLDAECATWGDPAFDVAFCLTHLLLKSHWHGDAFEALVGDAESFVQAYFAGAPEGREDVERRTAVLVAALLLARVSGKSPAEYLVDRQKAFVRAVATRWLEEQPGSTGALLSEWKRIGRES